MMEAVAAEFEKLKASPFDTGSFFKQLEQVKATKSPLFETPKGNTRKYTGALAILPHVTPSSWDLNGDRVRVGVKEDLSPQKHVLMKEALLQLCPWRKGPFDLFGIPIDSEWQSNIKWDRFASHISSLYRKRILDVGSSNGYYMLRMAAQAPSLVVGLEPQHTFFFQYLALQKYLDLKTVATLPLTFDDFPLAEGCFDTVFCMGVLYHRKSPIEMLQQMHRCLKTGGELVLENLIIEGDGDLCLFPENRYAKMKNVYFIPTVNAMTAWLRRSGFNRVRCVDISLTTPGEQRKTPWIQTESLSDFLDPHDPSKTVEGYPAPVRAVFIANAR